MVNGYGSIDDGAACIVDRDGAVVYETSKWRQAAVHAGVPAHLPPSETCGEFRERAAFAPVPMRTVSLDNLNPIAPGGMLLCLTDDRHLTDEDDERRALNILCKLTPRERDIVALTLDGYSTGAIAQRLGIAKGSIKNCRLRVYRKFAVSSERALIALMMPLAAQLKAKLHTHG